MVMAGVDSQPVEYGGLMSPRELPDVTSDPLPLPELPAHLRPLADEIIHRGPEGLAALFGYIVEQTANDPTWNRLISETFAGTSLLPAGVPTDLDDGLIYKVKITLRGVRPAIFREVEIPNISLGELHEVIQTAMGWDDAHPHCFTIDGEEYGELNEEMSYDAWLDEESLSLGQLVETDQRKFTYEYDFGDSWSHDILISKPKPPQKDVVYPRVVKGELACPPEDCGGIWGYMQICELLNTPQADRSPDDKERMEWVGEFDPQQFSLETATNGLQELLAPIMPDSLKPKKSRPKSR